jgi:signal transduction histidine kinase/CheY-like chemotaxis protein
MEDYALRYAPKSYRKWSAFQVANTALGSTSFLVLEAIGGFLTINYGFTNAVWAILAVGLVIFITGLPVSYYAARYHIDIDLLTRSAGFGYIGSTLTSLIYASFTFTLFALEASIMSLALELYFQIPLAFAHVISALIVIPLVTFGITTISRMQLWTQPVWLVLLIVPYIGVFVREPEGLLTAQAYWGIAQSGQGFNWLLFGSASTVAFSMVAQIGEQVDFLRFMPDLTQKNRWRWWCATLMAGPGWIIFGMCRQLGGAFLAHLAIRHGIPALHAHEPTQMYLIAFEGIFENSKTALAVTTLFVVISQVKINVTNAYAGSLAWSNFFSRVTHSHPGRVIWLFFNVSIALLLMEFGVFSALEKVLGLFSNISIAWISAVAADLLINKPLGLSPKRVEFKRAYLPDLNPVGTLATLCASIISISAYLGWFGVYAKAFSAFISLGLAFVLVPLFAFWYGRKRYLTRRHALRKGQCQCSICVNQFEQEDMAYCPYYGGNICSLCCSLDSNCMDACKPGYRLEDYLLKLAQICPPRSWAINQKLRLIRYFFLFVFLGLLSSLFVGIIYYQDLLAVQHDLLSFRILQNNFIKVYTSLLVFIGLCTWWLILNDESRRVAREEINKQTERLLMEIEEHKKTDAKLKEATKAADRANIAKSRFLSNMSHEIRTPLNSIIGYAYILQNDPAIPQHRRQAVSILKRSGEHLSSLIEDILDIARIEACKFEFNRDIIDFPHFIDHLQDVFKPQADSKGLSFRCKIYNTLPKHVRADEKRVGQILINLLGNAVKFTNHGEILFGISYSCGVATFQIKDTGPGIDDKQLENIFQPFTQLAQESIISGSGLGLTISKILAELMGGELSVCSRVGEGSTFTVKLYLANAADAQEPLRQQAITGYTGAKRALLCIDDQIDHRQLIRAVLEPLDFAIYEADSLQTCLQVLTQHEIDLLLLDLSMPDTDGFQIAQHLRQTHHRQPIIVLSANAYAAERVNAINSGCNDFLAKPLHVPELLNKLKLHLDLNWTYPDHAEKTTHKIDQAQDLLLPEGILQELNRFIRIGDLIGLNGYLKDLEQLLPEHAAAIQQLQTLSTGFRLPELRQLMKSTLEVI